MPLNEPLLNFGGVEPQHRSEPVARDLPTSGAFMNPTRRHAEELGDVPDA